LYGIPYVPGRAQGKVQRHSQYCTEQDILLISQEDIAPLRGLKPGGIIVIDGAPYSHTMIQLLGLNIPTVIIDAQQAKQLLPQGNYRLDGATGEIIFAEELISAKESNVPYQAPPAPTAGEAVTTIDGVEVYLNASVSSAAAAAMAVKHGAAAIGLIRSEYLQPSGTRIPDAKYYRKILTEIGEAALPLTLTIRLLDMAPDKKPSWLPELSGMRGPLGLQGVRLYHSPPVQQAMLSQVSAINQLTARFSIRLLIPFVSSIAEFLHWRDIVISMITAPIHVGAMLEAPAAVLDINNWRKHADFVSIGCNDLMQCLFAADRDLPPLRRYLNPYAPALFRFLQQVAVTAADGIAHTQLCGLLAQWPGILPLLVAMGYRRYSVEPVKIPYLAKTLHLTSVVKTQPLVQQVCNASSAGEVGRQLGVPLPSVWSEA